MTSRRRLSGPAAALFAALLLSSCAGGQDGPAPPSSSPPATTGASAPATGSATGAPAAEPAVIATGLDAPWSIAFLEDTPLVSQRDSAEILELGDDGGARVVGTVPGVEGTGEGGLLGLAVGEEGDLYAYSTGADGNRIQRFGLLGEPGSLRLGPAETILDGIPAAGIHNGGRLAFGPDGMLYATTGDAGNPGTAQDTASLAGKILRLAPDGSVPADNPFPGSPVYSYGHRNPQGTAWTADGTMYASEFGQNTWDELNVIEAGANYGWPEVEGAGAGGEFTDPVQQWRPSEASPSGIAVLGDALYIANLRGQVLRRVPLADHGTSTELFEGEYGRLRDAVAAPDGTLWVLTNNTDGRGDPGPRDDRILSVDVR